MHALLDTGADISLITEKTFKCIDKKLCSPIIYDSHLKLASVTGESLEVLGRSRIQFQFGKRKISFEFVVVKRLGKSIILGSDFLTCFDVKWDFRQRTVAIGKEVVTLKDKRSDPSVALVRSAENIIVPPSQSIILPCTVSKQTKGEHIISPLDNSLFFRDQPGLLATETLVTIKRNRNTALLVKNETNKAFSLKRNQILAIAEPFENNVNLETVEASKQITKNKQTHDADDTQVEAVSMSSIPTEHIPASHRGQFKQVIEENLDIFAETDLELGRTNKVKMAIDTGDHPPIKQRPYKIAFSQRPQVDKALDDMLEADIIRPSESPWSSPLVIIPKKDGTKRMCVDYRKLNNVTRKNSYPLPDISEMLSSFRNAKVFSTIDLKSGYWQVEMEEKDKEKTALVCHRGLFEFNVLPFGLTGAPPLFQRLTNDIFREEPSKRGDTRTDGPLNKFVLVYLDDIIVYSANLDEHLQHLKIVFDRLRKANLKMKPSKCKFVVPQVEFLGHIISEQGIKPNADKIRVICDLKVPTTVRGVRSFLGMASYYRKFIHHFSEIASPLIHLTRKHARFRWNEDCDKAFVELKSKLCQAPVLAHPDLSKPYKLYTDASLSAIGAILTQEFPEGERVIQYISKQLSEGQRKWAAIEREAYAIVYAVNKLRPYLLGRPFTVFTDHKPLRSLFTSEMKNARIQRWAIILSEYGCDIEYKTGKSNVSADMLSRIAGSSPTDDEVLVLDSSDPSFSAEPMETIETEPRDDSHEGASGLSTALPAGGQNANESHIEASSPSEEVKDILPSPTELSKEQSEDDFFGRIMDSLRDCGDNEPDYLLAENLLYHVSTPVKKDDRPRLQLCIPKKHYRSVLHAFHDSEFGGGHGSVDKTYDKVRRRYYWPNQYRDVASYVNSCDVCKARRLKRDFAPMQNMPIPNYPFEMIAVDTCGPFPETETGNKYVVTFIDHFSAWPEAFAVKNKTAETVGALILNEIIPRHGCPRVLLSDRGTEFLNAVVSHITQKLHMVHLKSSPYHPQGNGKIERFHRYMNDVLSKYSYKRPLEWDTYIPSMLMTYRTSVQDSTLFSPFYMLHGRDPVLPMDTLLQPKLRYQGDDYVPTMLQRMHEVHLDAKGHMEEARERNKDRLDLKAKQRNFSPGDPVFYYNHTHLPGESSKLKLKWQPFFRIVEQRSPVNYLIKHQKTGVTKLVHVNDLQHANPEETWDKVWDTYETFDAPTQPIEEPEEDERPTPRRQPMRSCRLVNPSLSGLIGTQATGPSSRTDPERPVRRSSEVSNEPPSPQRVSTETPRVPPLRLLRRRTRSPDEWEVAQSPKRIKLGDESAMALDLVKYIRLFNEL